METTYQLTDLISLTTDWDERGFCLEALDPDGKALMLADASAHGVFRIGHSTYRPRVANYTFFDVPKHEIGHWKVFDGPDYVVIRHSGAAITVRVSRLRPVIVVETDEVFSAPSAAYTVDELLDAAARSLNP